MAISPVARKLGIKGMKGAYTRRSVGVHQAACALRSTDAWSRNLFVELTIGLSHSQLSEKRVPDNIQGRPMFEGLNRALENPAHAVTFLHDLGIEIEHLL